MSIYFYTGDRRYDYALGIASAELYRAIEGDDAPGWGDLTSEQKFPWVTRARIAIHAFESTRESVTEAQLDREQIDDEPDDEE